jgi:hypothetical protein
MCKALDLLPSTTKKEGRKKGEWERGVKEGRRNPGKKGLHVWTVGSFHIIIDNSALN